MQISEEAVEAVYDRFRHLDITTSDIEGILEAAAPHMLSDAWDDGKRVGWSDRTLSLMDRRTYAEEIANATRNPYRSQ